MYGNWRINVQPTRQLIDELYAEKVRRARATPIEKKLEAGPMLYEFAHEAARAGIRAQFPNITPQEVEAKLQQRLALAARLEEAAWTQTP
jgi:hypothetical protein